jgi:hypothetical protein
MPYGVFCTVGAGYTSTHEADGAAIQEQVFGAARFSSSVPPLPPNVALVQPLRQEPIEITQLADPAGPVCTTFVVVDWNTCPIVKVAPRTTPVFAGTLMLIEPEPVPDAADVIATKLASLCAVQEQPLDVVIATVDTPPSAAKRTGGDEVKVHTCCVIVNVWPPMVSVPVRTLPVVFAATL